MKRIALMVTLLALAVAPSAAFADSSSCEAYTPQTCNSITPQSTTTTSDGTLPFTGLDVALLAVGGGTLLGAGVVVRRLSRRLD